MDIFETFWLEAMLLSFYFCSSSPALLLLFRPKSVLATALSMLDFALLSFLASIIYILSLSSVVGF
jgi:hypothetical protein